MTANSEDGICATEHQIQANDPNENSLEKQVSRAGRFRSNSVKHAIKWAN